MLSNDSIFLYELCILHFTVLVWERAVWEMAVADNIYLLRFCLKGCPLWLQLLKTYDFPCHWEIMPWLFALGVQLKHQSACLRFLHCCDHGISLAGPLIWASWLGIQTFWLSSLVCLFLFLKRCFQRKKWLGVMPFQSRAHNLWIDCMTGREKVSAVV